MICSRRCLARAWSMIHCLPFSNWDYKERGGPFLIVRTLNNVAQAGNSIALTSISRVRSWLQVLKITLTDGSGDFSSRLNSFVALGKGWKSCIWDKLLMAWTRTQRERQSCYLLQENTLNNWKVSRKAPSPKGPQNLQIALHWASLCYMWASGRH